MVINAFTTSLYHGVSYKTLDHYFAGQKMLDKAAELVATLENISSAAPQDLNALFETDAQKAQATLDEMIKQSIKEITDIRKSLGITEAAGQNKPLEELFSTIKGKVFDTAL